MEIINPNEIGSKISTLIIEAKEKFVAVTPYINIRNWKKITTNIQKAGSRFQDIQVDIYPNPTQNWVNIKTKETYTDVTIIDVFGKTCYTGWSDRISMQNLAAGMYTINLTLADKRVYSKKLILIK